MYSETIKPRTGLTLPVQVQPGRPPGRRFCPEWRRQRQPVVRLGRVTQASHPSGHVASWLTLMLMRRRDPSRRRASLFGQSGIQKAMSLNLPTQAVVVRFAFGARGQRPPQLPPGRLLLAPAIDTPVRTADQIVVVVLRDPAFDQDPASCRLSCPRGLPPELPLRPQRPGSRRWSMPVRPFARWFRPLRPRPACAGVATSNRRRSRQVSIQPDIATSCCPRCSVALIIRPSRRKRRVTGPRAHADKMAGRDAGTGVLIEPDNRDKKASRSCPGDHEPDTVS